MALFLARPVSGVTVDDDLVLLDIDADAYFCLPGIQGVRVEDDGRMVGAPPMLSEALVEAGLASEASETAYAAPRARVDPVARSARGLLESSLQHDVGPSLRRWSAILRAILVARAGRRRPFAELVVGPPARRQEFTTDFLSDLGAYRRMTPWLPIDGACLFRSHMLRTYLRALGHDASWVFGVSVWPFQAHCWLQVGDAVLDDEAERLAAYRPILVA